MGTNVFRCDRPRKGEGGYIYEKNHHLSSVSVPKQFELLALKLELSHSQSVTIIGCNRPPSAPHEALSDHCTIAATRNYKLPKSRPNIICKRDIKKFSIIVFVYDLA